MTVDLIEARRLEAAATTGPWMFAHLPGKEWPNFEWYVWGAPSAVSVGDATSEANAAFIAYMRNHATDYFDAVEQRDQLCETLGELVQVHQLMDSDGVDPLRADAAMDAARAALARLREPAKQGSGDEEGEL